MIEYQIHLTAKYKKGYKKMAKRGLDMAILDNVVKKLSYGEKLERKYKDHILKGEYKGYHECHIQPDWLLIYKIQDDVLILTLIDTGTHWSAFRGSISCGNLHKPAQKCWYSHLVPTMRPRLMSRAFSL